MCSTNAPALSCHHWEADPGMSYLPEPGTGLLQFTPGKIVRPEGSRGRADILMRNLSGRAAGGTRPAKGELWSP